jgi:hypothetical protein
MKTDYYKITLPDGVEYRKRVELRYGEMDFFLDTEDYLLKGGEWIEQDTFFIDQYLFGDSADTKDKMVEIDVAGIPKELLKVEKN